MNVVNIYICIIIKIHILHNTIIKLSILNVINVCNYFIYKNHYIIILFVIFYISCINFSVYTKHMDNIYKN